jgi:membrane associated rhomboid family serine protease
MQFQNDTAYFLVLIMVLGILGLLFLFRNRAPKKKKGKELSPELLSERKKFYRALLFPFFFLFLIWYVKLIEFGLQTDFAPYGIYPGKWNGLAGIITAPLIHADIKHLADNSVPVFILSVAIFYFYREIAYKIFFIIYFVTGFLVWIAGR